MKGLRERMGAAEYDAREAAHREAIPAAVAAGLLTAAEARWLLDLPEPTPRMGRVRMFIVQEVPE